MHRQSLERRMLRILIGWLMIVHAFAHALGGMSSSTQGSIWPATLVWSTASLGFLCAGFGLLRVPFLRTVWQRALVVGAFASILMIIWYRPPWGMPGIAIDMTFLIVSLHHMRRRFD